MPTEDKPAESLHPFSHGVDLVGGKRERIRCKQEERILFKEPVKVSKLTGTKKPDRVCSAKPPNPPITTAVKFSSG